MLRGKGGGLAALKNMVSSGDSEERVEKLRAKWKSSDHKLADHRNSYLINLVAANAQQNLYYHETQERLLSKTDGQIYALIKKLLIVSRDIETTGLDTLEESLANLDKNVKAIVPEADTKAFALENDLIMAEPEAFFFTPSNDDVVSFIFYFFSPP